MKVFIWVMCILLIPIVETIFALGGYVLGGIPTMLLCLGAIALAKGLCTLWDYRGLRSTVDVPPEEEEIEKPKWTCTKCGSENPTSARICKECGKYK